MLKFSFLFNRNFQWLYYIFFYVNINDGYYEFYKINFVFNVRYIVL